MSEFEDEKCLTCLVFLVDLTTHLNELNVCLRGESLLTCAVFQPKTAFEILNYVREYPTSFMFLLLSF